MGRWTIKLLTTGLAVLLIAACSQEQSAAPAEAVATTDAAAVQQPIVTTAFGPVRGLAGDGVFAFKGVRYGADTATTRFAAPANPQPWSDIADTTAYGASCPQTPTGNPGGLLITSR